MTGTLRRLIVGACASVIWLGLGAQTSHAQTFSQQVDAQIYNNSQMINNIIGSYFPTQLVPGETNVLHVALPRNNPVTSIEFSPSDGITVTKTTFRDLNQGSIWWEFTIDVAKNAAAGPRTLVATQQNGKTPPITLMIPNHLPKISNLAVSPAQLKQPTFDVQFVAADPGGVFDASPYVWYVLTCGPGAPATGVVWGGLNNGMIRASIPNPNADTGHAGSRAAGDHCNLQLRATDSTGVDSNTLASAFDFK